MKVKVLFFSQLRDVCGADELDIEAAELAAVESTVAGLLEYLYQRFESADLRKWDAQILVAADHEYVARDAPLSDGQEIAIMPPVQGG